eukprot:704208-Prorocentrum_minimum.AAC.3
MGVCTRACASCRCNVGAKDELFADSARAFLTTGGSVGVKRKSQMDDVTAAEITTANASAGPPVGRPVAAYGGGSRESEK